MFSLIYLHGIAQCTGGSRNNCNFMHRCRICLKRCYKGMSYFVIRYNKFLLFRKNPAFLLITCNHNFYTFFHICLCCKFSSVTNRSKRCFIYNICQLCAGCTGCCFCNLMKIHIICNFNLSGMNL